MKKANAFIAVILAIISIFSFTACATQENIDSAVNPISEQITQIDGYVDALESKVETLENSLATINTALGALEENSATKTELMIAKNALESEISAIKSDIQAMKDRDSAFVGELSALDGRLTTLETTVTALSTAVTALQTQVEENTNKIEELEKQLNCLSNGGHVLAENWTNNNDGTHSKSCKHCSWKLTQSCVYIWEDNGNGVFTAGCSSCSSEQSLIVTIGEYDKIYSGSVKEPSVTIVTSDEKTLENGVDYDLSYSDNKYVGTAKIIIMLKGKLSGELTVKFDIIQDPATGDFDGEWVTF